MKNVMVTGAAGFAGYRIADTLVKLGYHVVGIVRRKRGGVRYPFPVAEQELSQPICYESSFDAIVHAAGQHPGNTMERLKRDNVDSMQHLLEFAKRKGIPRIIYLSTVSVYGDIRDDFINEETDIVNPDPYGLSKRMAEILLNECDEVEGVSLRLPGILGLGSMHPWLAVAIRRICRGEQVEIYSPDFMSNNFVHVDDLAAFVVCLLEAESPDPVFVLGSREKISIRDCMETAKKLSGSRAEIRIGPEKKKPFSIDVRHALACGYQSRSPISMIEDCILGARNGNRY